MIEKWEITKKFLGNKWEINEKQEITENLLQNKWETTKKCLEPTTVEHA